MRSVRKITNGREKPNVQRTQGVTSELRRTGAYTFEYRELEAQEEMGLFEGEG